jgi:hypothetical protein
MVVNSNGPFCSERLSGEGLPASRKNLLAATPAHTIRLEHVLEQGGSALLDRLPYQRREDEGCRIAT